jgi:hypothetical protein
VSSSSAFFLFAEDEPGADVGDDILGDLTMIRDCDSDSESAIACYRTTDTWEYSAVRLIRRHRDNAMFDE